MATKKTTTKRTTTKKPAAKKTATRKPAAKKTTTRRVVTKKPAIKKTPAVIVKENTIKKSTCQAPCKVGPILVVILLIINTALLFIIAFKTTSNKALFTAMEDFEAMRVGGPENHEIMKEIYKLDAYKNDQKTRLETTLNALQQMNLTPTE